MIENEKEIVRQALSTILTRNIGNTITAEVANGILVAMNQMMDQLPKVEDSKAKGTEKNKEAKDGQTPDNTGDGAQTNPVP